MFQLTIEQQRRIHYSATVASLQTALYHLSVIEHNLFVLNPESDEYSIIAAKMADIKDAILEFKKRL